MVIQLFQLVKTLSQTYSYYKLKKKISSGFEIVVLMNCEPTKQVILFKFSDFNPTQITYKCSFRII